MDRSTSSAPARIVLLGSGHNDVIDDLNEISAGSTFLFDKERQLENVLMEAFSELVFVITSFQKAHADILTNGTPELSNYINQINDNSLDLPSNIIVELHAYDLSTYFKSFLLLTKAVLDKIVPFYSYQFYENIKQFSDKGVRLIKCIQNNSRIGQKKSMIELIQKAKVNWIDSLIELRDKYAHYSNLGEYNNFWISGDLLGKGIVVNIDSFNRPTILINGNYVDALEYMLNIKQELVKFMNSFLLLCEFTPERRPKRYLNCECGHIFAKKNMKGKNKGLVIPEGLEIMVKNETLDYAVLICPKCQNTTDTDMQMWRDLGVKF